MKNDQNIPFLLITFGAECLFSVHGYDVTIYDDPPHPSKLQQAVILNATAPESVILEYLKEIRKSPVSRLLPVVTTSELSYEPSLLTDGFASTVIDATSIFQRILRRLSGLPEYEDMDGVMALLSFLYSRQVEVIPVKAPCFPRYYRYPVIDSFCCADASIENTISHLQSIGIFEPSKLIDRVRICPHCEAAQINYVDVCPVSNSINIEKLPFLHCFTCGHVAPQESFISAKGMKCPNCNTNLRHIGSDYDRPLESYYCHTCSSSFIEPRIIARCMTCDTIANPEDLEVHAIHTLMLSEKGRTAVRTGNINDIFALLDDLHYVPIQLFEQQLAWMLQMTHRYPDDVFSVIGIRMTNIPELVAKIGRQIAYELLETFADRLRQLIRTTDIATRSAEDTLWIILPRTSQDGCSVLHKRVLELGENTLQPNGSKLELDIFSNTEDGSRPLEEEAEFVMAQYISALHGMK